MQVNGINVYTKIKSILGNNTSDYKREKKKEREKEKAELPFTATTFSFFISKRKDMFSR